MGIFFNRFGWRRTEIARIHTVCRGWSGASHFKFFEWILGDASVRRVLILGVYEGRDVASLASILRARNVKDWRIVGVDKFNSDACSDWPTDKRHLSWEAAGFGPSPELGRAVANLQRLGLRDGIVLVKSDATEFLKQTNETFDFIYLDTSHDYETTVEHIRAAMQCLAPGGSLGGDDYSDKGTWGVRSAVLECFRSAREFPPGVWLARREDYMELRQTAHS